MTQQEAEVLLKVNNKEALEKINQLEKQATSLREKFNDCFRKGDAKGIEETTKELNKVNKQINNMRTNAANIKAAMTRIDQASPKELHRTMKLINAELNSGRVPRGSKEWKQYTEQLKRVKRELSEVNSEMKEQKGLMASLKDRFSDWGASMVAATAAATGLAMTMRSSVDAYAAMEQEMANVRKFTGMSAEEVEALNEEFKKMDTRTSREDLNKLAQEAGRLGKTSQEDVLGFVRAADKINVALDDLGENATLNLSKLTQIFGDEERLGTEKALLSVGSVINELSQNCAASAPYLEEFASRMGGVGAQAGMSVQQIMGMAAVLDSKGQKVEASATAISQVITRMYQDPSKYAKAAGLDVQQFADLVRKDANEALLVLAETLNAKGGLKDTAPIFKEMGENGSRAVAALATLAENVSEVRAQQEVANEAFREAISIDNEYNVQNNTVQAGLDKEKKRFSELTIELGEKLLPVMQYAISGTALLVKGIGAVVDFVINYRKVLVPLIATIAAYKVGTVMASAATTIWDKAVKGFKATIGLAKVAILGITKGTKSATTAFKGLTAAIKANPFGLLLSAVTAVISAIMMFKDESEETAKEVSAYQQAVNNAALAVQGLSKEEEEEKQKLDQLFSKLRSAKEGTNEYKAVKDQIISQYGAYLTGLYDEKTGVLDLEAAYNRLTYAAHRSAVERAIQSQRSAIQDQIIQDMGESTAKLVDELVKIGYKKSEAQDLAASVAAAMTSPEGYKGPSLQDLQNQIAQKLTDKWSPKQSEVGELAHKMYRDANPGKSAIGVNMQQYEDEARKILKEQHLKLLQSPNNIDITGPLGVLTTMRVNTRESNEALEMLDKMEAKSTPYGGVSTEELQAEAEKLQKKIDDYQQRRPELMETIEGDADIMDKLSAGGEVAFWDAGVEQEQKKLNALLDELAYRGVNMSGGAETTFTPTVTPTAPGETDAERKAREKAEREAKKSMQEEIDTEKGNRDTLLAKELASYTTGLENRQEYIDKCLAIEEDSIDSQLAILKKYGEQDSSEYGSLLKKKEELRAKYNKESVKLSLQELKDEYDQRTQFVTESYYDQNSSIYNDEKAYQQALLDEELRYLNLKRDLYAENSQEYLATQKEIESLLMKDKLDKMKETAEAYKWYQSKWAKKTFEERCKDELALLKNLLDNKLITQEQYEKAVKTLRDEDTQTQTDQARKVKSEYSDMVKNVYDAMRTLFEDMGKEGSDFWANLSNAAQASFSIMGAISSQYAAYSNAERDLELAKMEQYYDAEIERAGDNSTLKEKIEKEKSAATAKIKKKYNDRAMKIELAQALAQTAQAAIAAYASAAAIPAVGWIMAPIAAALATAAGMVQVGIIKKQHEAEAIGYYEGGYTGGRNYRREAGVVHEGEFVANHEAVNNPRLSGLWSMLDYAQRNNTVGSLTAEDVSAALGNGAGVSARGGAGVSSSEDVSNALAIASAAVASNGDAITRLTETLDRGILADLILDGERGAYKKIKSYERLINNPKR